MTMSSGPEQAASSASRLDDLSHPTDTSPLPTTRHDHFERPPSPSSPGPQSDQPENLNASAVNPDPSHPPAPYTLSSVPSASPTSSGHILPEKPLETDAPLGEGASLVTRLGREANARPKSKRRHLYIWLSVGLLAIIVVVLAIVLPIVLMSKAHSGSSSGNSSGSGNGNGHGGSPGSPNNPESPTGAITGGNGSLVVMADGSSFTYTNKFGGFCTSQHTFVLP